MINKAIEMATTESKYSAFLGRGLGFPPTFDKYIRDIHLVEGESDIEQSLEIILSTRPGERTLQPTFGCNLDQFVFENMNLTNIVKMQEIVETALILHEPRVDVHGVTVSQDENLEGKLLINIDYSVRNTNSRYNFVYPFYLQEGTDLNLS